MWWRKGWLLNSLNYQVEKNLRESLYANTTFKENSWSWWEHQVLQWSARPVRYLLLVLSAFLLATFAGVVWLGESSALDPDRSEEWGHLSQWVGLILGAQATVIGLVFPLVVGFVGVLLQDKSANRTLLEIYRRYSGFMFTGLSGLALAGAIIATPFVNPWLSSADEMVVAAAFCLWFVFNLILIGWFLHATFRFMATGHRSGLILRYCINEVLVTEVASRLSEILPSAAANIGLLGPNNADDSQLKIGSIYFSREADQRHYIVFRNKRYLSNIYFRGLQFACFLSRIQALVSRGGGSTPELILPISGRAGAYRKWLVAVTRHTRLSAPVRWVLRVSYRFARSPVSDSTPIDPIIDALVGDVDDSLRTDNIRQYDYALDELIVWHREILSGGAFVNDAGHYDNWMLLDNRIGFGRSISDELSSELYQISRATLQRLEDSTRYFERFCNYFIRVYGWRPDWLALKVTKNLILGHYRIWIALMQWQRDLSEGEEAASQRRGYQSALRSFVGSWEEWLRRLEQFDGEWERAERVVEPYTFHLSLTGRQIVGAIRNGADDAAEWAVDILNNWYSTAFIGGEPYQYGWRGEFVVHQMLGMPVDGQLWRSVLNGQEFSGHDASLIALRNVWVDVRLATAGYLIKRSPAEIDQEHVRLVNALVAGARLKVGGSSGTTHTEMRDSSDILQAYIRQRWYWEYGDGTYSNWLDGALSAFAEMEQEEWVSGRVYSGWGGTGVTSVTQAYVAIAISLARRPWKLSESTLEFLFSEAVGFQHRQELIRNLRESWLEPDEPTLNIAKALSQGIDIQDRLENFSRSLEATIQQLEDENERGVIDARIDRERLRQLGRFASTSGFRIQGGAVPQSFFNDVEYVDQLGEETCHRIRIPGYDRSNIAEGIDAVPATNEDEWLDQMVTGEASVKLFRGVFERPGLIEAEVNGFDSLIEQAVRDGRSMREDGLRPVFLIGPRRTARLLEQAMWPHGLKHERLEYELTKEEGYPDHYICHLQGIETYQLPFRDAEFCILISRESFRLMRVRRLDDGRYVDVEFQENEENRAKGDLILSFWLEGELSHERAFKYALPSALDEEEQ